MDKKNLWKGILLILGGIVLFLLKWVPYKSLNFIFFKIDWSFQKSLDFCNGLLGFLSSGCGIIKFINYLWIAISIAVVLWGLYILFGKKVIDLVKKLKGKKR